MSKLKSSIASLRRSVAADSGNIDLIALIDGLEAARATEVLESTEYGQLTTSEKMARQLEYLNTEAGIHGDSEIGFILSDAHAALVVHYSS